VGGPDLAPHTPQRSSRRGGAVALLDPRARAPRASRKIYGGVIIP